MKKIINKIINSGNLFSSKKEKNSNNNEISYQTKSDVEAEIGNFKNI
jgi:hypothetical protein